MIYENVFDQLLKSKKITHEKHSKDYTLVKKMILQPVFC